MKRRSLRRQLKHFFYVKTWPNPIARRLMASLSRLTFTNSTKYWRERYRRGGTSGDGSYGRLANFKAEVVNRTVAQHEIESVVDWGCGDGGQLSLLHIPTYIGLDVSEAAIQKCQHRYAHDPSKTFQVVQQEECSQQTNPTADLALSLDVIYHLVEDDVFIAYLDCLFHSARRFVLIYSTDTDMEQLGSLAHVRHRMFTSIVRSMFPDWGLVESIPNPFPYDFNDPDDTSDAAFFLFARNSVRECSLVASEGREES